MKLKKKKKKTTNQLISYLNECNVISCSGSARWWNGRFYHDGCYSRNFQNSLQEGAKIVTGGGIYGTIKRVDVSADTVDVEIARGVVITVSRGYVFEDASSQTPNA